MKSWGYWILFAYFFLLISEQCEESPVGHFWLGDAIFSSGRSLKTKVRITLKQDFSERNAQ